MFAKTSKLFLASTAAALLLQGCVVGDDNYRSDNYRSGNNVSCGGNHKLRVTDLDMSPDPFNSGQRIDSFRVKLRADGSGECMTTIRIDDGDRTVATRTAYRLRPGVNEVNLAPSRNYRFDRDEHCFTVKADIARTYQTVDAARKFCARQSGRGRWTLN